MKKILVCFGLLLLTACLLCSCFVGDPTDNGTNPPEDSNTLGNYTVVIDSCRIADGYSDKKIVIVKYLFTNNGDEPAAFLYSVSDTVFQNGVSLETCYVAPDEANYNSDDKSKEIKKGVTLAVECAFFLNDTTTDIEVEVEEWISFNDKVITKTLSLPQQ